MMIMKKNKKNHDERIQKSLMKKENDDAETIRCCHSVNGRIRSGEEKSAVLQMNSGSSGGCAGRTAATVSTSTDIAWLLCAHQNRNRIVHTLFRVPCSVRQQQALGQITYTIARSSEKCLTELDEKRDRHAREESVSQSVVLFDDGDDFRCRVAEGH